MDNIHWLGTALYFGLLITLSCYGAHRYLMIYLYYRHRHEQPTPIDRFRELPRVTVQLPLYNEMYVVERLLDAVTALDYPKDKLEIQVLDDSTDETTEITARKVAAVRAAGFAIEHMHRDRRDGFKAGALQNGLSRATGEFVAIFDADFVPQPDLLQKTVHFFTDPSVGMIQTRWGHLNESYSLLTRLQSLFLDGHFLIEQTARSRSGRFFNFNGTAGLWRRATIEDAGGWHHDTLAEDVDLSYRAQLRGWRFVFLPHIVTPAELPVEMNAFKTQQHRWAKGLIQACKKTLPSIWAAPLPRKVKIEATVHLTSNFGHVLLLLFTLLLHPSAARVAQQAGSDHPLAKLLLVDIPIFLAGTISISAFYFCAQKELHAQWWKRALYVPLLMAVGVGLSVNNARAVLEALFNYRTEFVRTPKLGIQRRGEALARRRYRGLRGLVPVVELGFALYFAFLVVVSVQQQQWLMLPFLLVFFSGFAYVGLMSTLQTSWREWRSSFLMPTPANA